MTKRCIVERNWICWAGIRTAHVVHGLKEARRGWRKEKANLVEQLSQIILEAHQQRKHDELFSPHNGKWGLFRETTRDTKPRGTGERHAFSALNVRVDTANSSFSDGSIPDGF